MIMITKMHNKELLLTALVLPFALTSLANAADSSQVATKEMESVVVTASQQPLDEVVQPVKVISHAELRQASGSTLGELLETLPGISNASFGSGVGRPVIRGLSGNRVKIAVNGSDAADVSAMSNDHAPMAEAANAEQVEVIYGPGTLLFGSGAIGGVINLVDERIHKEPMVDASGQSTWHSQLRQSVSSNGSGRETSAVVDSGVGEGWVFHFDGVLRESEDYGSANTEVDHTQTEAEGFGFGISHIRDNGHSAVAISVLDYVYGVPNPNNEDALVTPYQFRMDGEFELMFDSALLDSMRLQLSINDYEHEEGSDGLVVGFFEKDNIEFKSVFALNHDIGAQSKLGLHVNRQELGLCHDHDGCEGGVPNYSNLTWDGTKGVNFFNALDDGEVITNSDGEPFEFPHDTPMPLNTTLDLAGFWIFSGEWANGKQEYAIRADQRSIELDPVSVRPASREDSSYYRDRDFTAITASAGWTWLTENQKYGLSVARTERAPQADEMFWNGDHHATFSYQLDNPDLEKETAVTLDLTWRYALQDSQWDAAVYYYDFDGFIYNELQAVKDPFHGNDVYQYVQKDAYLTGFELSWQYDLSDSLLFTTSLDHAVGRLKSGENKNLPRIPPMSGLLGLGWDRGPWTVKGDVRFYTEQDKVGENELATDGYETLNAFVGYETKWQDVKIETFLKANNLTDELGRNHVSYLKELAPVPGRNISFDIQLIF